MNNLYSIIFFCSSITHRRAVIGRTVINEDDFKIAVGLVYYAFYAFIEVLFDLVHRNNDAYKRLIAFHINCPP